MVFLGDADTVNVSKDLVYDAPFEFGGNLIVLQLPHMGSYTGRRSFILDVEGALMVAISGFKFLSRASNVSH